MVEVLGATPTENLDMIADSVAFVAERGREAVYDAEHFFDGYKDDRDYALSTLRAARQAGSRTLVLCDTNGGTMTDELVRIVTDVKTSLEADPDAPEVTWGIHTHNDAELAVANSMAAVAVGVRHVQATINGYGERCGNANMVSILANLALKTPHVLVPAGGGSLAGLTELSRSVAEVANVNPSDYQPYVGRSAFAHKGGVHGAAVAKVERSYQHVDPAAVGNVGRLVVSELGGRANTSIRAQQLGHELEGVVDPRVLSTLIKQLESEGLAFEGAEASFELLIRRHATDYAAPVQGPRLHLSRRAARRPRAAGRGDRQGPGRRRGPAHRGRGQRPGQRPGRGPAQGAERVLLRASTTSTSSTTRSASSTAGRRRPPGPGSSSTRPTGRAPGRRWAATRTSSPPRPQALADSLEYAIWKSGGELRRRDERHFTTARPADDANGPTAAAEPAHGASATPRR